MELSLQITPGLPLAKQLYVKIREAILVGRLAPGEKLPGSRALGRRLQLSRNTVNDAYERLASEGFLDISERSGAYVARGLSAGTAPRRTTRPFALSAWARRLPQNPAIVGETGARFDFRPGVPDLRLFPIDAWRRSTWRLARAADTETAGYGSAAGHPKLQETIARYAAHSRAVRAEPADVLVTSGAQQAFELLARILVSPGTVAAVEDPAYPAAVASLRAAGARVVPVPVDGEGIVVASLPGAARIVYVTPSHQFPLGTPMSLARRRALLDWAAARGALVIEDDYDSEFRYSARQLESLQGMDDAGVVAYVGTFSKTALPGLRLGYLVMPPGLRASLLAAKWLADRHTPTALQAAMADFMAEGAFERHLRRARRIYGERHAVLSDCLRRHAGSWLEIVAADAGLHVTALLRPGLDAAAIGRRALAAGIGLYSLAPFCLACKRDGFVFGFGAIATEAVSEGLRRLGLILAAAARDDERAVGRRARRLR